VRQSNGYIILFTVALTVICAGALAGVFEGLKGEHKKQEALDKKKQILSAVMELADMKGSKVDSTYTATITAISVNVEGDIIEVDFKGDSINTEKVNVMKMSKEKDVAKKVFPVFIYTKGDEKAYILPIYGNGLWDAVWGYVALSKDLNTIKGVSFGHKGETPGLGARITDKPVRDRFNGKQIFDADGTLQGVAFQKGEKIDYTGQPHKVDGLAGASMTTNGVNEMLSAYFKSYEPYFIKTLAAVPTPVETTEVSETTPVVSDSVIVVSDTLSAPSTDSLPISDTVNQG
jgi:Na+-transporting NADH:ubiquinone oxidoreductase subunit C